MRVVNDRARAVKAGGRILALGEMKGTERATCSVAEWALKITDARGKKIAFQYWWQISDLTIAGHQIGWSAGIERVDVVAPITANLAKTIAARAAEPNLRAHYEAALAAAVEADRQETDDLHAAKAAKRSNRGAAELTASQTAALRSDRQRNWRTWTIAVGTFVGTFVAVAAIGGLVALVAMDDGSESPSKSEPAGCSWDWVPGKAPVDVGWIDAVQYCYGD